MLGSSLALIDATAALPEIGRELGADAADAVDRQRLRAEPGRGAWSGLGGIGGAPAILGGRLVRTGSRRHPAFDGPNLPAHQP
ncbi:hypothetical protein [Actinoplanes sp. NPDC049802]|uniref:hypothetical protein n=1 Tax=Actinoplanes sp. NPDC049802 TaxID=3154742 RepID=UPI00340832CE